MSTRDTSYEASLLQSLTDPKEAAAYVEAARELDDPAVLLLALRQVAKARVLPVFRGNGGLVGGVNPLSNKGFLDAIDADADLK